MRKVTIDELRQMAADAREDIWGKAGNVGRDPIVS